VQRNRKNHIKGKMTKMKKMLKLRDPINSIREKIEDKIKIKGKINQN
jgi:hypothetical protein